MNFIAITYGYNQFSIFNTNVSTQPLIDCIINTCFEDLTAAIKKRMTSLEKEIDGFKTEEDQIKASQKVLETNIKTEEGVVTEKQKDANSVQKDTKKGPPVKKGVVTSEINKALYALKDEYHTNESKLAAILTNREKMKEKKKFLMEQQEKYRLIDKTNLKIDLLDVHGEKININSKNDVYANHYLVDKQSNTKEIILEPAKIDGFSMRTVEEDIKHEEYEKVNKTNKPKPGSKKK